MNTVGRGVATGCGGVNRRDFLLAGGVGLGALGFQSSLFGSPAPRSERALILLMMVGGPSQLETWDPKPEAPEEVRGPFSSIATRVPGVRINEHLPRLAARMDKLAIVRSLHHNEAPIHETGLQLLQTGRLSRTEDENPHIGAVVSRLKGSHGSTPPFVMLPGPIQNTGVVLPRGQSAGRLGSAHAPVCSATLDLRGEPERLLDAYGSSPFGKRCLQARRLVESGARVVTINMFDTVFNEVTWDCHGSGPFSTLDDYQRQLLPTFDQAFSALLDDLGSRGLLDTTLVAAVGEFGRTPKINAAGGRDHWPGVWSVALAGGGVRGGQVIGTSDEHAAAPIDRPVVPQELLASMYHALDVDPSQALNQTATESSTPTADFRPIYELFS
jgi:Protein of unknown function (DUF1501)